ncbi:MAG: ATP-binding cassette domain-containing protein [Acidimicrobiales bacterium]
MSTSEPLIRLRNIAKYFGNVTALEGVSAIVNAGEVTCVLGDNGAGKSTFIKILSGLHKPSSGEYLIDGVPVEFESPRDARERGIATVYQDLAITPLMSIWRNFFLGAEPMRSGVLLRTSFMKKTAKEELAKMGIDIRDVDQPVGTLSGGERQSVAISRAVYYGARVLILDEPTSALGVRQSGIVLRYVLEAAKRNLGVIFITHNPNHAYPVGDRFLILSRGKSLGEFGKNDITRDEMTRLMAGGGELDQLTAELQKVR